MSYLLFGASPVVGHHRAAPRACGRAWVGCPRWVACARSI